MSVPEQYSPIVPFESSPGAAAAGLPGRAPEDRRRVIADTPSDGRKGDVGDQTEGDDHDPGSASAGADGVGYLQRNFGAYAPQQDAMMAKNMRASAMEAAPVEEPSFEPGETTLNMRVVGKVRFR